MASGTQSAILNFPTSLDVYYSKVDRGIIVSGESFTIPSSAPYQIYTTHTPLYGSPGTTTSIPGFTEVTGTPSTNQYQVDYSGNNASRFSFSSFNGGNAISVTYTANGDDIVAEWFNSLQTSVTGIEAYIISGSAFNGNVRVTGSSMTGNLNMNGGSITTSVSGANNVGTAALPFAEVVADVVSTFKIQDLAGVDTIQLGGDIRISGSNAVRIESDNLVQLSGNISLELLAGSSGIFITASNDIITMDGHVLPTGSFIYDLGADTQRWRTVYANNIVATNNPYVRVTGDSMTGNLVIATGASINTDTINNASASLAINSSADINATAAGSVYITSPLIDLGSNLQVSPFSISVNSSLAPIASGIYDLGTASNKFGTIYADNLDGVNISGAFVHTTGDSMTGSLTIGFGAGLNTERVSSNFGPGSGTLNIDAALINFLSQNNMSFNVGTGLTNVFDIGLTQISLGEDMLPVLSGAYDIGAAALPLRAIYADNLHVGVIASGATLESLTVGSAEITGNLTLGSGVNIIAAVSGSNTIGSPTAPISIVYADSIVTNGATGTFLLKFGDTMLGDLALGTGVNITAVVSGSSNLGSASNPLAAVYADNLYGSNLSNLYVLKAGDTMTGPLVVPEISATGNLNIVATGFLNLTGNQITQMAQQLTLTSTVGPIVVASQTELQLQSNSSSVLVVNPTGIEVYNDVFPDISGTHSLGTPQKPFENIYAKNIIPIGGSGTGTFVLRIGDSMVGNLTFDAPAGIRFSSSGLSDIGSSAFPANTVYANNIIFPSGGFVHITGDLMTGQLTVSAPVASDNFIGYTLASTLYVGSGSSTLRLDPNTSDQQYILIPSGSNIIISDPNNYLELQTSGLRTSGSIFPHQSGVSSIGTVAIPYANLFATGIYTQFIQNNNMFNTGSSGLGNIGTAANPYLGVYAKTINGVPVPTAVYNEVPAGTINNVNVTFTTAYAALSGTQRLYRAGLRMTPNAVDYSYSGNTITFVSAPISGDNILIDYSHL